MPFHFVYGTSPRQLSHWIDRHIRDQHPARAGSCTRLTAPRRSFSSEGVTATAFLTQSLGPLFENREPISWIQILELVKQSLHKDRPFRTIEPIARLLLDCKTNLVFTNTQQRFPAFLDKLLAPYDQTWIGLYQAYERRLSKFALYDSGDVWELAFTALKERTFVFPSPVHTLYWDGYLIPPPQERLWLKALIENYPNVTVYLTTPLSYRDPDDPFFMSAFHELGELAHTTLDLSETKWETSPYSHAHYGSAYEALGAVSRDISERNSTAVAVADRLPKRDRAALIRLLDRQIPFLPESGWLDDLRYTYHADAEKLGVTVFSEEEFTDYAERKWQSEMGARLAPRIRLGDLGTAYLGGTRVIYIPFFQGDVFPRVSPIASDIQAIEETKREWAEILRSTAYLYAEDTVLLRLICERFDGSVHLCSSDRDLKGKELPVSPFASRYPITQFVSSEQYSPSPQHPVLHPQHLEKIRTALFAKPLSISQLETFSQCPFRFLMESIVKMKAPDDGIALPGSVRGSVIHHILELAVKEPPDFDKIWDKSAIKFQTELAGVPAFFVAELKREAEACFRHVRAHPVHESWQTAASEWGFEWPLPLPSGTVVLRGRIDRVLVHPQSRSFIVIDYKTSSVLPSFGELVSGTSLQLPLYTAAVKALLLPDHRAAGALYWNLADGELSLGLIDKALGDAVLAAFDIGPRGKARVSEEEITAWQRRAIHETNRLIGELKTTDFSPKPQDLDFCRRSCSWKRLCNYPWMEEKNS